MCMVFIFNLSSKTFSLKVFFFNAYNLAQKCNWSKFLVSLNSFFYSSFLPDTTLNSLNIQILLRQTKIVGQLYLIEISFNNIIVFLARINNT